MLTTAQLTFYLFLTSATHSSLPPPPPLSPAASRMSVPTRWGRAQSPAASQRVSPGVGYLRHAWHSFNSVSPHDGSVLRSARRGLNRVRSDGIQLPCRVVANGALPLAAVFCIFALWEWLGPLGPVVSLQAKSPPAWHQARRLLFTSCLILRPWAYG